jgi:hypothetical protein
LRVAGLQHSRLGLFRSASGSELTPTPVVATSSVAAKLSNLASTRSSSRLHNHYDTPTPHARTERRDMMEENRLFRFPRPAWLNSANTRTFGVYTAGALVGSTSKIPQQLWPC